MENVTFKWQRDDREALNGEVALFTGDSALLEVDLLVSFATVGTDGHFRDPFSSTPQFSISTIVSFVLFWESEDSDGSEEST